MTNAPSNGRDCASTIARRRALAIATSPSWMAAIASSAASRIIVQGTCPSVTDFAKGFDLVE